jgi:hypothetical protein
MKFKLYDERYGGMKKRKCDEVQATNLFQFPVGINWTLNSGLKWLNP